MSIASLRRRMDRVKGRMAPPARRYPVHVVVEAGETVATAIERHKSTYGSVPYGHGLFVTPAHPRDDREQAEWRERFREQQNRVVSAARRERVEAAHHADVQPTLPMKPTKLPRFIVPRIWKAS